MQIATFWPPLPALIVCSYLDRSSNAPCPITTMAHVLRVPKFDLAALLAQQNPHIDLRIEAYETSTRNFLKAVSQYTQVAQAEITRRKNEHLRTRKQIAEEIQKKEKDINQCKVKELELIAGASYLLRFCGRDTNG